MKVLTAPVDLSGPRPWVFLAGGITACPEWQADIIDLLHSSQKGTLLNPRRKDFPIDDPSAAEEQIRWEYHALEEADIFSMWFCNAPSDQPICMYELGRHLAVRAASECVLGVESGYRRETDVRIQAELARPLLSISSTLLEHAAKIQLAARENGPCSPASDHEVS